jgi:hypothetical protein
MYIFDVRDLINCGLDIETKNITNFNLRMELKQISGASLIIVVNGEELIVLKDRLSGISREVHSISMLPVFIYQNLIEVKENLVYNTIIDLSKYLDSKKATELSRFFERIAFERT